MNKVLALSVITFGLMISSSVNAIELYKDDKTYIGTRGYLRLTFESTEASDEITDAGSRWGLDFSREIQNGWVAGITYEWATNFEKNQNLSIINGDSNSPSGSSEDALTSRLGFVSMAHPTWGSFAVGKQWAVFYDVIGVTDLYDYYGGSALGGYNIGTDGGLSGTGRAEQAITWRKSFGNFNLGLQYQAQDEDIIYFIPGCEEIEEENPGIEICDQLHDKPLATIGNGYGVAFSYQWHNFLFGIAHNEVEIDIKPTFSPVISNQDDSISAASVAYGDVTSELYVAVGVATSEYHEVDDQGVFIDTIGAELMVRYSFESGFGVYGGFNHIESDEDFNDYEMHYNSLGVDYLFMDGVGFLFIEGKMNDITNADGSENDDTDFAAGIRINM